MKNLSIFAALALLCACGEQSHTAVILVVPASSQPTAMSVAPTSMPPALGKEASGAPPTMTTQPSSPPTTPSNTTIVNNVSINITNVIESAYDDGATCAEYELPEGYGYCDEGAPKYAVLCDHGKVYMFDCRTYGEQYNCGYTVEHKGEVVCLEPSTTKISDNVAGDVAFAYKTEIPCTAADERAAECQGSYAYYCLGGTIYAQDCAQYHNAEKNQVASCGLNGSNQVDCYWP